MNCVQIVFIQSAHRIEMKQLIINFRLTHGFRLLHNNEEAEGHRDNRRDNHVADPITGTVPAIFSNK